jgi:hypothetical protein
MTLARSAEIWDPETAYFTRTGPMVAWRVHPHAITLLDGRVLVVGGGEGASGERSAEVFEPR